MSKKVSRQQINEVLYLIKEVQELSGKKILFEDKEPNRIHNIMLCAKNIERIMNKYEENFLEYESKNAFRIIMTNLHDIQVCCREEVKNEIALTEDVKMTMDQITKNPDDVKKLNDKKINIDLYNPDDPNNNSSSTTSQISNY